MARHFKIRDLLQDADRTAYEEFLRGVPQPTIDDGVEWLAARGYEVSRKAVWSHRKNFEEVLNGVRQSAEVAKAFTQVAKESGVSGMNDAILARFQQLQMEWAFAQLNGGELTPEDMERFAKSMNQAASAAQRNEDLRKKFDEAMQLLQSRSDKKSDGKITAEDVAEVRRAIFG
jgi:hypothetical protein